VIPETGMSHPDEHHPAPVPAGAGGSWALLSPAAPGAPADGVVPAPQPAAPSPYQPADPSDDDDLFDSGDDAFHRPGRTNGWTRLLLFALIGVIGFGGGVLAQKSHDTGLTSSAGGATAFRPRSGTAGSATGGGFGAGGFGPGGPGGFGNGQAGQQAGQGANAGAGGNGAGGNGGSAGSEALPVVVGTVTDVAAGRITVTNFGGKAVPVAIGPTTTITLTGTTSLTKGLSASVIGTKGADGTVTATAITVHKPSS
jgi:hypothetical protein